VDGMTVAPRRPAAARPQKQTTGREKFMSLSLN